MQLIKLTGCETQQTSNGECTAALSHFEQTVTVYIVLFYVPSLCISIISRLVHGQDQRTKRTENKKYERKKAVEFLYQLLLL